MADWFTSDTHFHHARIIEYAGRPFADVHAMNEALVARWNTCVSPGDTVYHCGDFAFGPAEAVRSVLERLHGRVVLVAGNHDRTKHFGLFPQAARGHLYINGSDVLLVHDVARTPTGHVARLVLHGHAHGARTATERAGTPTVDVGVDCWGFRPVALADIAARVARRPRVLEGNDAPA
jgi:calcineurin-like phosphoesterase family protein